MIVKCDKCGVTIRCNESDSTVKCPYCGFFVIYHDAEELIDSGVN